MARPVSKPPEIGTVFTYLTVIGNHRTINKNGINIAHIDVSCKCGILLTVCVTKLKTGRKKSCGCLPIELFVKNNTTDGLSRTKEYRAWTGMLRRCYDKKCSQYKNYGGRGITVCKRWKDSLLNFIKDMGLCPSPDFSLDRINNNGNYKKINCRWADIITQCNNRRSNLIFEINGVLKNLTQISKEFNINYFSLWSRLKLGFSIEKAISKPFIKR